MPVVEMAPRGALPVLWLLCGGPSSEHHVSLASAKTVLKHVDYSKFCVRVMCVAPDGRWLASRKVFVEQPDRAVSDELFSAFTSPADYPAALTMAQAMTLLERDRPLCAFNAMHGRVGEDGTIQGLFSMVGVPVTGSGVTASALAMDKVRSRLAFEAAGLRVPKAFTCSDQPGKPRPNAVLVDNRVGFPCFVKPVFGGSSLGVTKVRFSKDLPAALDAAFSEGPQAILEEAIVGMEVTCGVLEDEHGEPRALMPTEIRPKNSDFFDFKAKYVAGESEEITPARLDDDTLSCVRTAAVMAHKALGCAGYSRADFILDERGDIYTLEVNTLPGFTETSLLPQGAAAMGIDAPSLAMRIIVAALRRRAQMPFSAESMRGAARAREAWMEMAAKAKAEAAAANGGK